MKRLFINLIILLVLTVPTLVGAQTSRVVIDDFEVGRWVTENKQALKIPSIAVGIVGPEKDYYLEAFGPAELEQPFLIGSLSKAVTAMAVMLLVQDGALKLTDGADQWVKGVPPEVTIEHLLHQTSGLERADGVEGWTRLDATVEDLIEGVSFGPVGKYNYSNLNYAILGKIVATASGKSYGEFVQRRIFAPTKMTTASAQPTPPDDHVKGQQYMFGFPVDLGGEPDYSPAMVPAGFIWMSPRDMTQWIRLFIAKGKIDGAQVVPAEVIEQLLAKPDDGNYAMGWLRRDDPTPIAEHTGATAAFTSAVGLAPEREFGAFVFTNVNLWLGLGTTNILEGVMSPVLGLDPKGVTNIEFIVRLGFGLVVALIFFTFLFEAIRWIRSKFPMGLNPKERVAVALTLFINVAVVIAVTQYFGTPIQVIIATQPDLGYGFLVTIVLGSARQLLTGFNKTAHQRALAGGDE